MIVFFFSLLFDEGPIARNLESPSYWMRRISSITPYRVMRTPQDVDDDGCLSATDIVGLTWFARLIDDG